MAPILRSKSFDRAAPKGHSHTRSDATAATAISTAPSTSSYKITHSPPPAGTISTILLGPKKQSFKVNKALLCEACSFFDERLNDPRNNKPVSLWLPRESGSMFGLFVEWVHLGHVRFRQFVQGTITGFLERRHTHEAARQFHWALIRLHLFASHLSMSSLQDLAMDVIQDLYLKCCWDISPELIHYIYTQCEDLTSVRLRRWAVASVAFCRSATPEALRRRQTQRSGKSGKSSKSLPNRRPEAGLTIIVEDATEKIDRFTPLLEELPDFSLDYNVHLQKLEASGLEPCYKNPQLRLPANRLRNGERAFGYRLCSFHSHRATVGERLCPHEPPSGSPEPSPTSPTSIRKKKTHLGPQPSVDSFGMSVLGLAPSTRRPSDTKPPPMYSHIKQEEEYEPGREEEAIALAIKHVRSVSSTLK